VPVIKNATISGIKVTADDNTGLAINIEPIMVGGNLKFNNI
jgi:calcineurin-like phosphoesterase